MLDSNSVCNEKQLLLFFLFHLPLSVLHVESVSIYLFKIVYFIKNACIHRNVNTLNIIFVDTHVLVDSKWIYMFFKQCELHLPACELKSLNKGKCAFWQGSNLHHPLSEQPPSNSVCFGLLNHLEHHWPAKFNDAHLVQIFLKSQYLMIFFFCIWNIN